LKQWPVEHFRDLAVRLAGAGTARVVVIGAPADAPLGRAIADAAPGAVVDVTGRTTLRQTVALLRRSDVCVTTDTGPLHMAVAAGTRVVALFGPSDHRCYGPRGAHEVVSLDLPCSPATRDDKRDRCARCELGEPRCMIDLPVERVLASVRRALAGERQLPLAQGV
jgi:ADP-heptose:LPS heptosyltransferase